MPAINLRHRPTPPPRTSYWEWMSPFPDRCLPSVGDVLRAYFWYKLMLVFECGQKVSSPQMCNTITGKIISIWERHGIPTLSYKVVYMKVMRLIVGETSPKRKMEKKQRKRDRHLDTEDLLFDICSCPCFKTAGRYRTEKESPVCTCDPPMKQPAKARTT